MARILALVWAVFCLALPGCAGSGNGGAAFTNVTIIDVTGGPSSSNMTVVVKDGRISSICPTGERAIEQGIGIIDAAGKYMIPGLCDMHVHFLSQESNLLAMVANGVTFVRDMGSIVIKPGGPDGFIYSTREEMINNILETRERIAKGELLGPAIATPGVILPGPLPPETPFDSPEFQWALTGDEEAREAVRYLNRKEVDFFKVHTMPSREVYLAVADEAKKVCRPFAGHVPLSISAVEAVEAGQASIEHQTGVVEYMALAGDEQEAADRKRAELFDIYAQYPGTWHVPTLVVSLGFEGAGNPYDNLEAEPRMQYIRPELLAWWKKYWPPEMFEQASSGSGATLENKIAWVGEIADRGIKIMAGTDLAALLVYPGFSLHDELVLLRRAGLSPLEVLQTATLNPARFLGLEDERGSVEAGKIADLVLLDEDPLQDIANTRKIAGVVVRGRYLSRSDLDDILEEIREDIAEAYSNGGN